MRKPAIWMIREDFKSLLADLWKVWEKGLSRDAQKTEKDPFSGTYWMNYVSQTCEDRQRLSHMVGWLQGVSAVTGWSLIRPGPREWSPRDRV
jgi:hypothetical protein